MTTMARAKRRAVIVMVLWVPTMRYNYEAHRSGSIFAGWNFASDENVTFQITLLIQRTRVVDTGRDLQRGAFAQFTVDKATLGIYAFNPDSGSRYWIMSLGMQF